MPVAELGVVEARDELSSLLTDAEHGQWRVVRDRSGHRSVLAERERLASLGWRWPSGPQAWVPMSQARASFPRLHREGQQAPVGITRRNRQFVLTAADAVQRWLDTRFRFSTEVIYEQDGGVALWVPELAVYGRGGSYSDARQDLVAEVLEYLDEWEEDLNTAPNHRSREGWVRRLQLLAADPTALAAAVLDG